MFFLPILGIHASHIVHCCRKISWFKFYCIEELLSWNRNNSCDPAVVHKPITPTSLQGEKVKQMKLWCFTKICRSATPKNAEKHIIEAVVSAPAQFNSFIFSLIMLFICLKSCLWLLWWGRNVTLVCDYLYEVCIWFPPTWVIAFFSSPFFPFFNQTHKQ